MKSLDPSLGSLDGQVVPLSQMPASSVFTDSMNRGGLTYPSEVFLREVKKMEQMFNNHHPPNGLRCGQGVVGDFLDIVVQEFPNRDRAILALFARTRTYVRMRTINRREKMAKKTSLRNKNKIAQLSMHC
jgi:hypothetical protein